jgi:N4-(beta-N-acetylglucosaminyl)-L-asparaginase
MRRRDFVKTGSIAAGGLFLPEFNPTGLFGNTNFPNVSPFVITTWDQNLKSTQVTYDKLTEGLNSLDAVEAGIRITEDDPNDTSVGYGGLPDEDGIVTLDAAIMDWKGNAGAVAAMENIKNPISVAKLVMQKTNHVMLAGDGAKKFALENGFKEENLLTENAKEAWLKWKQKNPNGANRITPLNHDTIGILAVDKNGNMSGGVSTSGVAFKIHGRVGDSPIIGAALYLDNNVGGAVATGHGEFVMKTVGSFLVVEKMREGYSPQKACEYAVKRVSKIAKENTDIQIGFLALNKKNEFGAYSLKKKFSYCVGTKSKIQSLKSNYYM